MHTSRLLEPVAGVTLESGDRVTVTWESPKDSESHHLGVWTDDGRFHTIAEELPAEARSMEWRVPEGIQGPARLSLIASRPGGEAPVIGAPILIRPPPPALGSPVVSSFSPQEGPPGTPVVIAGQNLSGVISVSFGAASAAGQSTARGAIVQTMVPAGATTGPITVLTLAGEATSAASFRVTSGSSGGVAINGFSPQSAAPFTTVTINGRGLDGVTTVTIGGVPASIVSRSEGQIQVTVPDDGEDGFIAVSGSTGSTQSSQMFVVADARPPVITSFSPMSVPVGQEVTIKGKRFIKNQTMVQFSGAAPVGPSRPQSSKKEITVKVPAGAMSGTFDVITPAGRVTSGDRITITTTLAVTSFAPTFGRAGAALTISGSGFTASPKTRVFFIVRLGIDEREVPSADVAVDSETTIRILRTPALPAGTNAVLRVRNADGKLAESNIGFLVLPEEALRLDTVSPPSGAGGQEVTLTGAGFVIDPDFVTARSTKIFFGAAEAGIRGSDGATQIKVTAPSQPAGTVVDVKVVNVDGMTSTLQRAFTYGGPPAGTGLSIQSVNPNHGAAGDRVTITGGGFKGTTRARFGQKTGVVNFSGIATSVDAIVPLQDNPNVGAVDVVVFDAVDSSQSATLSNGFTYDAGGPPPPPPPTTTLRVTSVSPSQGPRAGGTWVTIRGSGFVPGARVTFGFREGTITSVMPDTIMARTPSSFFSGTVDVTVTNPGGVSDTLFGGFTYGSSIFEI